MNQNLDKTGGPVVGGNGLLRNLNHRAVYEELARGGPSSRSDLARKLELSPASVGRVAETLIRAGLVEQGERVAAAIGRPQTLLRVNSAAGLVAGASIRSRRIRLHLADLDGQVVARAARDRRDDSASGLADQLREMIVSARDEHAPGVKLASLVVGISGVWSEVERRAYAPPHLAILDGEDVKALFEDALTGELEKGALEVDNDVNLAALGEWEHGAARGVDDFFYLSLGSGVGGSALVGGTLHRGTLGWAGEVGYLPVFADGEVVALERVIGRRALEEYAAKAGVRPPEGEVFAYLARRPAADAHVGRLVSDVLGQALVAVVVTLNPRMIVLGGGVGRYSSSWLQRIREKLEESVPVAPRVVSTELGKEASLLGAVGLGRTIARDSLLRRALVT